MSNIQFENYNNLQHYCNKLGLYGNDEFIRWLKDIVNTKVQMVQYKGLPDKLTSKIVETALLFNNFLCLYKSEELGEIILARYRFGGDFDIYWQPTKVEILTLTGKVIKTNVPFEDIILVRDNLMDIIPFITLKGWLDKIIEMEKTLDVMVRIARFPLVLSGDKSEVAQLKVLLKKNYNCEPIVIGDKNLRNRLESNDINLPVKLSEVYEILDKYKNLALASIGIYGVDSKRERVVTSEIESNNDYVDFVYTGMLEERRRWIDEANKRWGLNIEVVEVYDINTQEDIELETERTKAIETAKVEAENKLIKEEGTEND